MKLPLYRNIMARHSLDLFFVSAASGVLGIRLFLQLTGYPQLGGDSLHIAHMLYGGLFMMGALILQFSFIGKAVGRTSAIIGGLGFGLFIDELGKFITKDNNYFFEPAVGIIYGVFVLLYLTFSFLSRTQKLTTREYQLNALIQLQEAVEHDMDADEKKLVAGLLAKSGDYHGLTRHLRALLEEVEPVPDGDPSWFRRFRHYLSEAYLRFWRRRNSDRLVEIFFVGQAVVFVVGVFSNTFLSFDALLDAFQSTAHDDAWLTIGQLGGSIVAAVFALAGALYLSRNRPYGLELFRRAVLVNLLFTEFFIFTRVEFAALPSFVFNLVLFGFVSFALAQESRLKA